MKHVKESKGKKEELNAFLKRHKELLNCLIVSIADIKNWLRWNLFKNSTKYYILLCTLFINANAELKLNLEFFFFLHFSKRSTTFIWIIIEVKLFILEKNFYIQGFITKICVDFWFHHLVKSYESRRYYLNIFLTFYNFE